MQERFELNEKIDNNGILPPNMDYPYFDRVRETGFLYKENDFSLVNACFLAETAFIAYNHPSFIKYAFYYAGFEDFKMFIGKNVARCFAVKKDDCLVVAFRGTEIKFPFAIPGFFADLKIKMAPEKNGGLVHSGFQAVLDEIWEGKEMLCEYLSKQKEENKALRIFLTGHSLGGALSLLCASRFPDVDCVYTFGCPRVGNKDFTDTIKAKVFRIVNNNDIVAELPPQKLVILKTKDEYLHIGNLKLIDSKGKIRNKEDDKLALLEVFKGKNLLSGSAIFEEVIGDLVKTRTSYLFDHSPYYYPAKLWNAYLDSSESAE